MELQRAGYPPFNESGKLIVDPKRIWQVMEPRSLGDAHRRFVGSDLKKAHAAANDASATANVLKGMLSAFALQDKTWRELARLCDVDRARWIGGTSHLQWRGEKVCLSVGKHKWRPVTEIAAQDPGYLRWLISSDFPEHVKRIVREALARPSAEFSAWLHDEYLGYQ